MKFNRADLLKEIESSLEYFERSSRPLTEADSNFSPASGMLTVAQQVAHIGLTIDWFLGGAFSPQGFSMDFAKMREELMRFDSLQRAREFTSAAYSRLSSAVSERSEPDWLAPLAPGPVMGGEPRLSVIYGVVEHTAHHRGALTVYTRLLGKTPMMPYMEM